MPPLPSASSHAAYSHSDWNGWSASQAVSGDEGGHHIPVKLVIFQAKPQTQAPGPFWILVSNPMLRLLWVPLKILQS